MTLIMKLFQKNSKKIDSLKGVNKKLFYQQDLNLIQILLMLFLE